MTRAEKDEQRDERIKMEIIVDTYSPEEQAMGWHAYLDDTLDFPFEARCLTEREESPLKASLNRWTAAGEIGNSVVFGRLRAM
jgi:hypothetical protein